MGIISSDQIVLDVGFEITNYYVNIDNIRINKSHVSEYKYEVSSTGFYYINKEAREKFKPTFKQHPVVFTTNTLDNIENQVYTTLKKHFINFTDVFEETPVEETSNATPESTTV